MGRPTRGTFTRSPADPASLANLWGRHPLAFRLDVIDGWWCADLPGIAPRQSALKIRDPGIGALHILGDRGHAMTQAIVPTP